uniref:Uncharacterized protein n=1 Tax=Siphoviridae sp. ctsTb19 TaxID=2827958 RepID=A0A8S5SSU4_9CAUD|nr:MAG TPA: hypothetical protein [Siphoviridae sp. ctsTb19]
MLTPHDATDKISFTITCLILKIAIHCQTECRNCNI